MNPACPKCNSLNIAKRGYERSGKRRYRCLDCNKQFAFGLPVPTSQKKTMERLPTLYLSELDKLRLSKTLMKEKGWEVGDKLSVFIENNSIFIDLDKNGTEIKQLHDGNGFYRDYVLSRAITRKINDFFGKQYTDNYTIIVQNNNKMEILSKQIIETEEDTGDFSFSVGKGQKANFGLRLLRNMGIEETDYIAIAKEGNSLFLTKSDAENGYYISSGAINDTKFGGFCVTFFQGVAGVHKVQFFVKKKPKIINDTPFWKIEKAVIK